MGARFERGGRARRGVASCRRTRASRCCSCAARACASTTTTGREYLDFVSRHRRGEPRPRASGGHRRRSREQMRKLVHVSNLYYVEHRAELAERARAAARRRHARSSSPTRAPRPTRARSSSRAGGPATHKPRRVPASSRSSGRFHGRTLATLAATGQPRKQEAFAPLPEGFVHVPLNDIDALDAAVDESRRARCCSRSSRARAACGRCTPSTSRRRDASATSAACLLMLDEVQTGFFRTGPAFAHQAFGIKPDVMTLAKALANGLPIGARRRARRRSRRRSQPGDHGSTFGGGPGRLRRGRGDARRARGRATRRERARGGRVPAGRPRRARRDDRRDHRRARRRPHGRGARSASRSPPRSRPARSSAASS